MNIDKLVENIRETVERHRIEPGGYRRWLWNNASGGRQLGVNEYGCADAANILYTIGCFEGNPAARENWVRTMQGMQDPETGLFHEATHHPFHTTAHVAAALELFDARPLYPVKAMLPYLDRDRLYAFLEGLDWEKKSLAAVSPGRGAVRDAGPHPRGRRAVAGLVLQLAARTLRPGHRHQLWREARPGHPGAPPVRMVPLPVQP